MFLRSGRFKLNAMFVIYLDFSLPKKNIAHLLARAIFLQTNIIYNIHKNNQYILYVSRKNTQIFWAIYTLARNKS